MRKLPVPRAGSPPEPADGRARRSDKEEVPADAARPEPSDPRHPGEVRPSVPATWYVLCDTFSWECWRHEGAARVALPTDPASRRRWQALLADPRCELDPEFLLVESAWQGLQGSPDKTSRPRQLVSAFRSAGVPVVYWNKEDPPHHERFRSAALACDIVLSTDRDSLPRYREAGFKGPLECMVFAAQPAIHRAWRPLDRPDRVLFAGSWLTRHPDRARGYANLVAPLLGSGLDIFSRAGSWPPAYRRHIRGSLPYLALLEHSSRYPLALSVSSVKSSPTMFPRRVVELPLAGVLPISDDCRAVARLFPEIPRSASARRTRELVAHFRRDEEARRSRVARLQERILARHSAARHLAQIRGLVADLPAWRGPRAPRGGHPPPTAEVARRHLARRRGPPLEAVVVDDLEQKPHAEEVWERGWRYADQPSLDLREPVAWPGADAHRGWAFRVHSWEPISALLTADGPGETRWQRRCLPFVLAWLARHPGRPSTASFAWNDMATGLRAWRLGALLQSLAADPATSAEDLHHLWHGALEHLDRLVDPELFAAHSNHGLYQAMGLLFLSRRLAAVSRALDASELARRRIRALLARQVGADGMHREHSPGYHLAVLRNLELLARTDTRGGPAWRAAARRLRVALSWLTWPDGRLVPLGDTLPRPVPAALREPEPPPGLALRCFEDGGYAVVRAPDTPGGGTHLVLAGAFHSRVHKHADDLSLSWFDRGVPLLVEPGRFAYLGRTERGGPAWRRGFWYADPRRRYVESTHAHNTVEVDGRSQDRRGRAPYGSAIRGGGLLDEGRGPAWVYGRVDLEGDGQHGRLLVLQPGAWLLCLDRLDAPGPHTWRQWFHLPPGTTCDHSGGRLLARPPGVEDALSVEVLSPTGVLEAPREAQLEPRLQGWRAHTDQQLVPAPAVAALAEATGPVLLATLLRFADVPPLGLELAGAGADLELHLRGLREGTLLRLRWPSER